MNKKELIDAIAQKTEFNLAGIQEVLNAFINITISQVAKGDKVAIAGLGIFEKSTRAKREGLNPFTKEKIIIPAKNAPKFKAGQAFKDAVAAGK